MRTLFAAIALALLTLALTSASASADVVERIIEDCSSSPTGELQGSYRRADLRRALPEASTGDTGEYTSCRDAILTAMRRGSGTGGPGGGGAGTSTGTGAGGVAGTGAGAGGGFSALGDAGAGTPSTSGGGMTGDALVTGDRPGDGAPITLGDGRRVTPSIAVAAGDARDLPPALIAFLVLLGAGTLGVAATTLGRRVLAHRRL